MHHGRCFGILVLATFGWTTGVAYATSQYPSVKGEFVVKLKSHSLTALNSMEMQSVAARLGSSFQRVVSSKSNLILVKRPMVETEENAVQSLTSNSIVEYAEPNYIYKALGSSQTPPNDPEFGKLWGMSNTGQAVDGDGGHFVATPGIDIDAVRAWQIETGSQSVVVAVIDTGVNYKEPDLADNIFNNLVEVNGKPGIDDDNNGWIDDFHGVDVAKKTGDPIDGFGHGTHCAATLGAKANDGYGVVGVAWNVTIMPVRFLADDGTGNLADAVTAVDYATQMKVNIMSNSWGGGPFSQALMDAISRAKDAGILFVVAAGNDANNNDATPTYPSSYALDNVLAVAALDPNGALASFSNYGKTLVHVAAPGVDILSHTLRGLESWSGTSMATPHVSGVAALMLAHDPSLNYLAIKNKIIATSRPLAGLRGRTLGGMVNAYNALTGTIPGPDPNDPFNWQKSAQTVSTDHPYANSFTHDYTLKVAGATQVAVHFSKLMTEATFDTVVFKDGNGKIVGSPMSGQLGDVYGPVVNGDTVTITFTSDSTYNDYGFDVSEVAFR